MLKSIRNYQKNHINPTGGGGVIYVVIVKKWKQITLPLIVLSLNNNPTLFNPY